MTFMREFTLCKERIITGLSDHTILIKNDQTRFQLLTVATVAK